MSAAHNAAAALSRFPVIFLLFFVSRADLVVREIRMAFIVIVLSLVQAMGRCSKKSGLI
jgi:hypothetical protein